MDYIIEIYNTYDEILGSLDIHFENFFKNLKISLNS